MAKTFKDRKETKEKREGWKKREPRPLFPIRKKHKQDEEEV